MADGYITLSGTNMLRGQIFWISEMDIASNSSLVRATLQVRKSSQFTATTGTFSGFVKIQDDSADGSIYETVGSDWVDVAYNEVRVYHNSDGSGSVYIEGSVSGPSGTSLAGHKASGGATVTLDNIPRQAALTSAQDFTDESNPTIGYSNPAGYGANSLQAAIYSENEQTAYAAYRNISKTGSAYTFNLTAQERENLRNATPTKNSMQVKFFLKCVIGTQTYYASMAKTMTIVNGEPAFSPVLVEQNTAVAELTGDENSLVRFVSVVKINSGAVAVKGATLNRSAISCGNQKVDGNEAVFSGVESGEFVLEATDSRNNSASHTVKKDIVDYIKLTCDEDCDVVFLKYDQITKRCEKACEHHSKLVANLFELMAKKTLSLGERIQLLSRRTTRDKLMYYFRLESARRGGEFTLPMSHTRLAEYLCVDRSAMVREIKRLSDDGLVAFDGKKVRIIAE